MDAPAQQALRVIPVREQPKEDEPRVPHPMVPTPLDNTIWREMCRRYPKFTKGIS